MDAIIETVIHNNNFTSDEVRILRLFWEPLFNKSWIYVSGELVRECFGYKSGKDMMNKFITRVLIPNLTENIDYQCVDKTHKLVQRYSVTKDRFHPSHNRNYYIITGEAFKMLMMIAHTKVAHTTRIYYLKIEQLAQEYAKRLAVNQLVKVELDKYEYKSRDRDQPKLVYFMRDGDWVKLGHTKHPHRRMQTLHTGSYTDFTLITTLHPVITEHEVHQKARALGYIYVREWYKMSHDECQMLIVYFNDKVVDRLDFNELASLLDL